MHHRVACAPTVQAPGRHLAGDDEPILAATRYLRRSACGGKARILGQMPEGVHLKAARSGRDLGESCGNALNETDEAIGDDGWIRSKPLGDMHSHGHLLKTLLEAHPE
jgi:hypothetical protein